MNTMEDFDQELTLAVVVGRNGCHHETQHRRKPINRGSHGNGTMEKTQKTDLAHFLYLASLVHSQLKLGEFLEFNFQDRRG